MYYPHTSNGMTFTQQQTNVLHFYVCGRVQGVGFRRFVLNQAQIYHISGCVRNMPDGRVEVWARGFPDGLSCFVRACQQGPMFAAVDNIDFDDNKKMPLPMQQGQECFIIVR